ncbi:hypothetical protein CCHR01_17740 [Colletotrichum chrysophilum]|uniref:Uncharacterized protein n=1 Tax=Colletotrichum chrysophilum TaxID=1836956 RepID=A0AAD9A1V9_9PEZI|nr:hypothetical protein CCHR01_17740 [Colletotrichum chrysophilum]
MGLPVCSIGCRWRTLPPEVTARSKTEFEKERTEISLPRPEPTGCFFVVSCPGDQSTASRAGTPNGNCQMPCLKPRIPVFLAADGVADIQEFNPPRSFDQLQIPTHHPSPSMTRPTRRTLASPHPSNIILATSCSLDNLTSPILRDSSHLGRVRWTEYGHQRYLLSRTQRREAGGEKDFKLTRNTGPRPLP